jgi:SAM-dependent methyltransferase
MTASPYLLDNAERAAARRMQVLERLFDGPTRQTLLATGVRPGWRCLEVGGGGGSVARWLAGCVAPAGSVLCTDLDPRHIAQPAGENLRIERHDIVTDPLPAGAFDLIHARLVLLHLSEREAVLRKLTDALAPDGWLVIEDFDVSSLTPDASVNPAEVRLATADAMRAYMSGGGVAGHWGRRMHAAFRACGLANVRAEARLTMLDAHTPGTDLLRVNFEQLGDKLVAAGLLTRAQLNADTARLDAEDFSAPSPMMWTVSGRRLGLPC